MASELLHFKHPQQRQTIPMKNYNEYMFSKALKMEERLLNSWRFPVGPERVCPTRWSNQNKKTLL